MAEGQHLIQDNTECPDIRLVVVGSVLAEFRGEVVGSTADSLFEFESVAKNSGDTKVAKFDDTITSEEDILRFEITMKDVVSMKIFDSEENLNKEEAN